MSALRKNVASQVLTFCLVNATTGAALTGASVTTKVTLDGTQSASAGTLTELGTGQYKYVPTQGETNGASVGFLFTATNAVPVNLHCFTTSQDPTIAQTGDSYARIGAPAGASVSADIADLPTAAENADANWDEARSGHVAAGSFGENVISDVTKILGSAANGGPTAGTLDVRLDDISVAGLIALGSAGIGSVSGVIPLDAAGTRAAVGLATANLDTQLGAIDDYLDTEVAAIKAKTDLIPAAPASTTNITAATGVTVATNNDKTGYALSAGGVQAIWDALTSALTTVGSIGKLLVDRIDAAISSRSTYAGGDTSGVTTLLSRIVGTLAAGTHNPQTGDSFARIGAAGAGLTALGDTRIANLDTTVSSRLAAASYTAPPSAAANASQVRTELTTELGRIDVAVSTRLATAGYTVPPTVGQIADANWDEALSGHLTAGTAGKALSDAGAAGTPLDAAGVRAALGMATANMDAQFNAVPTAIENADALLDRANGIDVGLTPRHALELAAASVLQKLTGAGTGTERVRNFSDTANLATVTVDGAGNKSAVIYDFSI